MSEQRHARGIVDTSVVIELERIDPNHLPVELALSAVTLAELAAGPHATADPEERARRQAAGGVPTAASIPPSRQLAAGREAGAPSISSSRRPRSRPSCPSTPATRATSTGSTICSSSSGCRFPAESGPGRN
jgi:hypothetical protein